MPSETDQTSDQTTPRSAPRCPKCDTEYSEPALECENCGIVFAKLQASPSPYAPAKSSPKHKNRGLVIVMSAGVGIVAVAILWTIQAIRLQPNEILVTYEHGATCKWVDWSFRYRRGIPNNKAKGNMLIVGPETYDVRDDTTLRVYSDLGDKLAIAAPDLREITIFVRPDKDNSYNNKVMVMNLETASTSYRFESTPLPKFSRSRVMVPVASHYFPEQSDDYMTWGNARLSIKGTVPEDCESDSEISLTSSGHPKKRTPVHIQFAGAP